MDDLISRQTAVNAPYTEDGFWEETSYCPYCGAKMDKILT